MAWNKDEGVRGFQLPSAFKTGGGGAGPAPVAPAPADPGGRNFGFRNTGAIREQGLQTAGLATRAAEVGEPTSFRSGAGAPEPIAVMRGTATTFSPGRLPGHQFAEPEMATPLQAQQVWNRGMRGEAVATGDRRGFTTPEATLDTQFGGFRAPGQTIEEVKAAKEPPSHGEAWRAQAGVYKKQEEGLAQTQDVAKSKQNVEGFNKWLHESPYSTFDAKTNKLAFVPQDENQARDAKAAENIAHAQGVDAGKQHFEGRQLARKWLTTQPLPPNFDVNAYLAAVSSDPKAWAELMDKTKASAVRPGPAARKPSSWFGPTQLQGEVGAPPTFVAPAAPISPTQPTGNLSGLVESME
jgi:hypothetical protein